MSVIQNIEKVFGGTWVSCDVAVLVPEPVLFACVVVMVTVAADDEVLGSVMVLVDDDDVTKGNFVESELSVGLPRKFEA